MTDLPEVVAPPATPVVPTEPKVLVPLTAEFREEEHGLYLKRIVALLDREGSLAVRSIALTGSYGSGKSSVLEGLYRGRVARKFRPIRISLSTIRDTVVGNSDGADATSSQPIQVEIVKQILYREKVGTMSGSRFRRVDKFRWFRAVVAAVTTAFLGALGAYFAGVTQRFEAFAQASVIGPWWSTVIALVVVSCALLAAQRLLHGRIRIKGLSAGPAQIEVREDESAFDRYLDEIVYFFSVSKCKVVVFEDLDRFKQIEIYEELRALNVLLNSSRQLKRPIRFIYAMRDSLFEDIAALTRSSRDSADQVEAPEPSQLAELRDLVSKAADRAKFFDVVVPMVPFATMRTALDLWRAALPDGEGVGLVALRIASSHIQDMRLIRSIANEYHVFMEEIAKNRLGIEPETVFALVVYKNVHLDDFEKIRLGTSSLDTIEQLRQDAITATLLEWDADDLVSNNTDVSLARAQSFATSAGPALVAQLQRSYQAVGRAQPVTNFRVAGRDFADTEASEVEFWRALSNAGWALEIVHQGPTVRITRFNLEDLTGWIGRNPSAVDWDAPSAPGPLHPTVDRDRLARAELHELISNDALLSAQRRQGLQRDLESAAKSQLAVDLISGGLLDQNFSLYVSRFYGVVVPATAMNYILHVAQKGRFAPFVELNGLTDVDAIVGALGQAFLSTPSGLNVSILDALHDDSRLEKVLAQIGEDERSSAFLQSYEAIGSETESIFRRLASVWPGVFAYLAARVTSGAEGSLALLDHAFAGVGAELDYLPAPELETILAGSADEIETIHDFVESEVAAALARIFAANGVTFADLSKVHESLRPSLVEFGLFAANRANFEVAFGDEVNWSLDMQSASVVTRLLTSFDEYLTLLPRNISVLTNQKTLSAHVRQLLTKTGEEGLRRALRRSPRALRVLDLSNYPPEAWTLLVDEGRVTLSPSNVLAYLRKLGMDVAISRALSKLRAPYPAAELTDAEKQELALEVLVAESVAVTKRARYVRELGLAAPIIPGSLPGIEGELVSHLVEMGLTEDSADTFVALRDRPVAERVALVRRSRSFSDYLSLVTFSNEEVAALFASPRILTKTKLALLAARSSLPSPLSRVAANAVGAFISSYGGRLPPNTIEFVSAGAPDPALLVELMARYQLSTSTFRDILSSMPRPWRDLSGHAVRKPLIPNSAWLKVFIEKLKAADVVASYREEGEGLRVQVRKVR